MSRANALIAEAINRGGRTKQELSKPSSIHTIFIINRYRLQVRVTEMKTERRNIGTAFILGHSDNAVVGSDAIGAGTLGSWVTIETSYVLKPLQHVGRQEIADWFAGNSVQYPQYVAFGTSTASQDLTDTVLGNKINEYPIGTYTQATSHVTLIGRRRSTLNQGSVVREIALMGTTSGPMYARYVLNTTFTLATTQEHRATFKVKFSGVTSGRSIITNKGRDEVIDWFVGDTATPPTHMAWGTGTTALDKDVTTFYGEQQRNEIGYKADRDFLAVYREVLETSQANSSTIRRSALFNHASTGVKICESLYPSFSKNNSFRVEETNDITIV